MYKEYFIAAKNYLKKQGMNPVLRNKKAVSEADIERIDRRTDWPMPLELRRFYIEMGDAFEFIPNDVPNSPIEGWEPSHLNDYTISNEGFATAIEEELLSELANSRPRVDPEILCEEAERRKKWIPFYGFVGQGDVLCLDSQGKVQFYQAMDWTALPAFCNEFVLADSFTDFVVKWSKYSFVTPGEGCGWTSFCWNRSGVFNWAPSHFPPWAVRSSLL